MARPPTKSSSPDNLKKTAQLIELERLLVRGESNPRVLATYFGMSIGQIQSMMKEVEAMWRTRTGDDPEELRQLRLQQLSNILRLSLDGFETSKRNSEEVTIHQEQCGVCKGSGKKKPKGDERTIECDECQGQGSVEYLPGKHSQCRVCHGRGEKIDLPPCDDCHGRGKRVIETVKSKGQAGDPSFLGIAKTCVEAMAKIEGLYPKSGGIIGQITQQSRTIEGAAGQQIREQINQVVFEIPVDTLIQAKAAIANIRKEMKTGEIKVIEAEGRVVK